MIIAICTTTVETTIMTWALSMEVKSSPIRDHQEGRRIASQQQTLQRWKSKSFYIWYMLCCQRWPFSQRKFEEKLAKDFPLRADGQKTTLELVRLQKPRFAYHLFTQIPELGEFVEPFFPKGPPPGARPPGWETFLKVCSQWCLTCFRPPPGPATHPPPASDENWTVPSIGEKYFNSLKYPVDVLSHWYSIPLYDLRLPWTIFRNIAFWRPFHQIKCLGNFLTKLWLGHLVWQNLWPWGFAMTCGAW